MDLMDISKMRRTVRRFADTPVTDAQLHAILEAGRWAPTAVNAQPQRILVLNTPERLELVRQFCSFGFEQKYVDLVQECDDRANHALNFYYGAPLVLYVAYDRTACWTHPQTGASSGATDATIVATHMMLEAASLGLGSAWISFFDEEKAKQLLALPEEWKSVCLLYVGHPAPEPEKKPSTPHVGMPRKPLEETCFFNFAPTQEDKSE
jgi:nitroreductase